RAGDRIRIGQARRVWPPHEQPGGSGSVLLEGEPPIRCRGIALQTREILGGVVIRPEARRVARWAGKLDCREFARGARDERGASSHQANPGVYQPDRAVYDPAPVPHGKHVALERAYLGEAARVPHRLTVT